MSKWSKQQYQRFIRETAKDCARVVFTAHAEQRMRLRRISHAMALEVLRKGLLRRTPEPNMRHGTMECRMEYYVAGRNLGVVSAVVEADPDLVVITAMEID
ncbi:MAG: DUF4258 domain-containing protein [Sulfuritalea sp.]|jgi:hypothetical protein|nr:DUF4258 domain-containing protein [Sulfuritalea sp.]